MADKNEPQVQAPVEAPKSSWLREVEEDAVYITNKRFAEAAEEKKRTEEKAARDAEKASK